MTRRISLLRPELTSFLKSRAISSRMQSRRVAFLQVAISQGRYRIPTQEIARRLLADALLEGRRPMTSPEPGKDIPALLGMIHREG